jgi:hypothetical protein
MGFHSLGSDVVNSTAVNTRPLLALHHSHSLRFRFPKILDLALELVGSLKLLKAVLIRELVDTGHN